MSSTIWKDFIDAQANANAPKYNGFGSDTQNQSSPIPQVRRTIVNPQEYTQVAQQQQAPMGYPMYAQQQAYQPQGVYGGQNFMQPPYPASPYVYPQQPYPYAQQGQDVIRPMTYSPSGQDERVSFPAQKPQGSQPKGFTPQLPSASTANEEVETLKKRLNEAELRAKKAIFEARHDTALTMCRNDLAFREDMEKMTKRAGNSLYRIVAFNIDLRYVNKSEGRKKGDDTLKFVAKQFAKHFEYVYRISGEKFNVITANDWTTEKLARLCREIIASSGVNSPLEIYCGLVSSNEDRDGKTMPEVAVERMFIDKKEKDFKNAGLSPEERAKMQSVISNEDKARMLSASVDEGRKEELLSSILETDQLMKELEEKQRQVEDKRRALEQQEQEYKDKQNEVNVALMKKDELLTTLEGKQKEIEDKQNELEEQKRLLEEKRKEVQDAQDAQNAQMSASDINSMSDADLERSIKREQLQVTKELAKKQQELFAKEEEVRKILGDIESVQRIYDLKKKEIADVDAELKLRRDEVQTLKDTKKELSEFIKEHGEDASSAYAEVASERTLTAKEEELKQRQEALSAKENNIKFKEGSIIRREQELSRMEKEIAEKEQAYNEKDSKIRELEDDLEIREHSLAGRENVLSNMTRIVTQKEIELKKSQDDIKARVQEIENKTAELETAEKELAEKEKNINESRAHIEQLDSDLEKQRKMIEDMEKSMTDKQKVIEEMKIKAKQETEEELRATNEKIAQMQASLSEVEEQHSKKSAEISSMEENIKTKREEMSALENNYNESLSKASQIENDLAQKQMQLASIDQELKDKEQIIKQAQSYEQTIEENKQKADAISHEVEAKETELNEWIKRIEEAKAVYERTRAEKQNEIDRIVFETQESQKKLEEIQKKSEEKITAYRELKEDLKQKEADLKERANLISNVISSENTDDYDIPNVPMEDDMHAETMETKYLSTMWWSHYTLNCSVIKYGYHEAKIWLFPIKRAKPPRTMPAVSVMQIDGEDYKLAWGVQIEHHMDGKTINCNCRFNREGQFNTACIADEGIMIMEQNEEQHIGEFEPKHFGKVLIDGDDIYEVFPIKPNINGTCDCIIGKRTKITNEEGEEEDGYDFWVSYGTEKIGDKTYNFILSEDRFEAVQD